MSVSRQLTDGWPLLTNREMQASGNGTELWFGWLSVNREGLVGWPTADRRLSWYDTSFWNLDRQISVGRRLTELGMSTNRHMTEAWPILCELIQFNHFSFNFLPISLSSIPCQTPANSRAYMLSQLYHNEIQIIFNNSPFTITSPYHIKQDNLNKIKRT